MKKHQTSSQSSLSNAIIEWAATRSDDAVLDPRKGYYPFDVIADAFEKGIEHGEKNLKEQVRKKYFQVATNTAELITKMLEYLKKNKFHPSQLFVKISIDGSAILMGVDEKTYISDNFIDKAYGYAADLKADYYDKGLNIEIGFLDDKKTVAHELLKCDGYAIGYDLKNSSQLY